MEHIIILKTMENSKEIIPTPVIDNTSGQFIYTFATIANALKGLGIYDKKCFSLDKKNLNNYFRPEHIKNEFNAVDCLTRRTGRYYLSLGYNQKTNHDNTKDGFRVVILGPEFYKDGPFINPKINQLEASQCKVKLHDWVKIVKDYKL
jgi:hypothetical protein